VFDDVMLKLDDLDALGDQIGRLAGSLAVGAHRLVTAIGHFDAAGGYAKQGAMSCPQWLSWKIGMGKGEAREKVRVARRLRELPELDAAFGRGEVSYSKVRAVTRVATSENEELLIDIAKYTTGQQLERVCRKFRSVVRAETPTVAEAEEARYVRHHWTDDGMLSVSIQLPADEGARFLSAIDAAKVPEGASNRADGLTTITESFLASGASPRAGGAPHDVVVHVTAETLANETEGAFIANHDGPAVSAETARRLSCDASVTTVVRDGTGDGTGAVLDVGRKTRTVPAAMRRALEVRDEHRCTFPGCDHRRYLDAHHAVHWADGGDTKLSNVVLTCRRHHTFLHEHGYRVAVAADGRHRWFDGDGRPVASAPLLESAPGVSEHWRHIETDEEISAEALTKLGWYENVDTVEVVDALAAVTLPQRTAGGPKIQET